MSPTVLVIRREFANKVNSKAWQWSTAVTLALVVALCAAATFLSGDDVAAVGVSDPEVAPSLEATATGLEVDLETRTLDPVEGRTAVGNGDIDAFVDTGSEPANVVVREQLDDQLRAVINGFAGNAALNEQITRLGGDAEAVGETVARSLPTVEALEPPQQYEDDQLAIGIVAGILIYIALLMSGVLIAQGVVEEKTSRVVELLLSTIRPWQLMAGKVLGLGGAGLLQVAIVTAGGAAAAIGFDVLTISVSTTVGIAAWLVVWFLLGYLFYALLFAAAGALVSRQEEVGGITTPATLLLVLGYLVGASVLPSDPDNGIVSAMSIIPIFSPTMMPMRLAIGGVPAWQAILSVVLIAVLIPVMVRVCGRIYANAIMNTGERVRLRAAFRSSDAP